MRKVNLELEFAAAESLLAIVAETRIEPSMRGHLKALIETALREASTPGAKAPKPRIVGEHGEP